MFSSSPEPVQIQPVSGGPLSAWIASCAPKDTTFLVRGIQRYKPYSDNEASIVSGSLCVRKREFETGRHLARNALARLGCGALEILADVDRVLLWPAGYIGSISHSASLCMAGVAKQRDYFAIGVDLEPAKPLESTLVDMICRPDERSRASQSTAMAYFVAKEAFYKAYFPVVRQFLNFSDVAITFHGTGSFQAHLMNENKPKLRSQSIVQGHITLLEGHYVAIIWI